MGIAELVMTCVKWRVNRQVVVQASRQELLDAVCAKERAEGIKPRKTTLLNP